MITLELPPKVQIDKHIPSGYVIRGYTEKEMLSYALEFSFEYNKQLTQRIIELESKQIEMNVGWVRACDKELISLHLGVANLSDSYDSAKSKLKSLIDLHITIATDPAVNGGFSLQPVNKGETE